MWSPATIAPPSAPVPPFVPPPYPPSLPPPACPVCMHTVPGETCDQIANHTSNLEPHLVCHQLHELYGCDCNGCECLRVPPSSPPDPASPPPLLPPLPPMAPAEEDPIQIFAMVLLIFVSGALCGALCLVGSCLLGWLDQGALRSPAAPMRHPPAAPTATYQHTPHTAHHIPHTTHRTPPPPSRSTRSRAVGCGRRPEEEARGSSAAADGVGQAEGRAEGQEGAGPAVPRKAARR